MRPILSVLPLAGLRPKWLLGAALLVPACHTRPVPGGTVASASTALESSPGSAARCGPGQTRGPYQARLSVGNRQRTTHVIPPPRGTGPYPVLVAFHGRGGNGAAAARSFSLAHTIRGPFLGLYPNGRPQPWMQNAIGWDTRDEASTDLEFFDRLLEWARQEACADLNRVAVLGYSWGGGMANHVACTRPSRVRAVVSVGGSGPSVPCSGSVSAIIVHGASDREEPVANGRDSAEAWSFAAGCSAGEERTWGGACTARRGCESGRQVLWCEHSGGHAWPALLRDPGLGKFLGID